eukprot:gene6821-7038_t
MHVFAASKQKWGSPLQTLQLSLPKVQKIKTIRQNPELNAAAEVRETPRLVVDSLKGNVFVNQYLIIKDLGRGAHGTVKLVLHSEEQKVYAMKVIHRKQGHRRYSVSVTSINTGAANAPAAASASGLHCDASLMMHARSVSAGACLFAGRSGRDGGSPVAAAEGHLTPELVREMAIMKKLDHPHVVRLHEVIHDPDDKLLIMVMEFMPGGAILSSNGHGRTEPLPEALARSYFSQLVSGLDYLHSNLIMHGDLKPDNLLLSADGLLKISDFGSGVVLVGNYWAWLLTNLPSVEATINTTMGTPAFFAPEMCGPTASPFKPFPAECWALGICLFMFVFGKVPYSATSTISLYKLISDPEPVQLPEQPAISSSMARLIKRLLDKDPKARMSLQEVFQDEWVSNGGRLPPLRRWCEQASDDGRVFSPVGVGLSRAEQNEALTGLKQQVKQAIPRVEERTYRRGQVLVEQGKVPEGLFLILSGRR